MSAARVGEQSAVEPTSSVMMSSTLGAPFGGTTRAGQNGFEPFVERSILPPNFCGGGGSCLPSMVVVAEGEPGVPVVPCARGAGPGARRKVIAERNPPI